MKNDNLVVGKTVCFGKSYAARMLCTYYDSTCNSRSLLDKVKPIQFVQFINDNEERAWISPSSRNGMKVHFCKIKTVMQGSLG